MNSRCAGIQVSQFLHRVPAIDSTQVDEATVALLRANEKAKRGLRFTNEAEIVGHLLRKFSLTSGELELAQSRLQNANRYAISGEFGAATWELHALSELLSPFILDSKLHSLRGMGEVLSPTLVSY